METAYDVLFTANAEKDLLNLKKLKEPALDKIMDLKQNPLKGHMLKGSLNGVRALKFSIKGVVLIERLTLLLKKTAFVWFL
ncbi:MAG: hypothetical protein ACYCSW_02580 [bacterium]